MASTFLTKIFGSRNERMLKQYRSQVQKINALESEFEKLSDAQLTAKTELFRQEIQSGKKIDAILPLAFAVVREASKRVMRMRHFDVQMMGAMALHEGKIAEMRTGEGKTLTSTLAVYLNALEGKGVHVVTVNDYLAERDAAWMGKLYNFLGLSVGVILSGQDRVEKQAAYQCDITYGTNNEYGFDYLRDNMVYEAADRVQRGLHYAIVDEVDSILIDEARTPLIISGQADDHTEMYLKMNAIAPVLVKQIGEEDPRTGEGVITPGDFTVDEKAHQVYLTERGHESAERIMTNMGLIPQGASLYDPANIGLMHHLYASLRAHHLYHKDQHYVVQDGPDGKEVVIVDEFTGRLMSGRRWSDGLHQAVEAKEGVQIQAENQTLASITFQNYFRLYRKLSGMTGTADTEAYEFKEIYGLETVVVPPNRPSKRKDEQDRIYKTTNEKYQAAIEDIRECHKRGQPVLVGTSSIENSEIISALLKSAKLPHEVLNAKQHAREADIITQAGREGMITIATNMAGRGTDIVLGGNIEKQIAVIEANDKLSASEKEKQIATLRQQWQIDNEKVKALGGLRIIATERNESRRIDNQLRGRAGRQGDPGSSRFYLSLDDPLMRIFAGDKVRVIMDRLKMPEGEAIEAGMVSRSIESAQRKVEARNFDVRKQLLEFDDVSNEQRKVIYSQRNNLLDARDVREQIHAMREGTFTDLVRAYVPENTLDEQWDIAGLETHLRDEWHVNLPLTQMVESASSIGDEDVLERVIKAAHVAYDEKVAAVGAEHFMPFERMVLLQNLDSNWREHLAGLDHLRQGIHLRGYAQKQPKQEYKREAFELFGTMLESVKTEVTRLLMTVKVQSAAQAQAVAAQIEQEGDNLINVNYAGPAKEAASSPSAARQGGQGGQGGLGVSNNALSVGAGAAVGAGVVSSAPRIGRNDPCPCGSGKKFKHCHGQLA